MPVLTNTYSGGMDRDSSKNKYQPNSYYLLKNMRITSFEELSNGVVQSIKGNLKITDTSYITNYAGFYDNDAIIGHCIIRNWLVFWSTDDNSTTGGRGTIWKVDLSLASPTYIKVYEHADMNLTTLYPIYDESIGYYESDTIIKVYWTDHLNMIRFVNIADTSIFVNDLPVLDVSMLNILPNVSLSRPEVINIGGGNIYVGKIQYSFQYYNIGGVETVYAPCTPLIHLTQVSEGLSGAEVRTYQGSPALDSAGNPNSSGKSVTIQINNVDTNYEKLRVISILYRNLNQEPEIHIVGEYDVFEGIIVTDYGNYLKGTISLNAFRTLGNHELYCKTIAQKGNKMVIGNITEKFFDIANYDTRAYRFAPTAVSSRGSKNISVTDTTQDDGNSNATTIAFDYPVPIDIAALTSFNLESGVVTALSGTYYEDTPENGSIANRFLYNGYTIEQSTATFALGQSELVTGTSTSSRLDFSLSMPSYFNDYNAHYLMNSGAVNSLSFNYHEVYDTVDTDPTRQRLDYANVPATVIPGSTTTVVTNDYTGEYLLTDIDPGQEVGDMGDIPIDAYMPIISAGVPDDDTINIIIYGAKNIALSSTGLVSGSSAPAEGTVINPDGSTVTTTISNIRLGDLGTGVVDISGMYWCTDGIEYGIVNGSDVSAQGVYNGSTDEMSLTVTSGSSFLRPQDMFPYDTASGKGLSRINLYISFRYTKTVTTTLAPVTIPAEDEDDYVIAGYTSNSLVIEIPNCSTYLKNTFPSLIAANLNIIDIQLIGAVPLMTGSYSIIGGGTASFYDSNAIVSLQSYHSDTDLFEFTISKSDPLAIDWITSCQAILTASISLLFQWTYRTTVDHIYSQTVAGQNTYSTTSTSEHDTIWNFSVTKVAGTYLSLHTAFNPALITNLAVNVLTYFKYQPYNSSIAHFTYTKITDSKIGVTITNFKSKLGISSSTTFATLNVAGTSFVRMYYDSALGDNQIATDNLSTSGTEVYNAGTDTFTFELTASVGNYFTNFTAYGSYAELYMDFAYTYTLRRNYTFGLTSDVNFTVTPPGTSNPWQFNIVKGYGNFFDPVLAINWVQFTLSATVNVIYAYTSVTGKRIVVYNSKINTEEEIKTNLDLDIANAWPNTEYTMLNTTTSVYEAVPEEHDCINPYNYDFLYGEKIGVITAQIDEVATYCLVSDININPLTGEPNNANQFKWQSDLATLGGEGPNIKYEFVTTPMVIENNTNSDTRYEDPGSVTIGNLTSYDCYKNPLREATILSNKRDEVYRYALVATNTKGQDSFAYWIGDIKFPTVSETPITSNIGRQTTASAIGIKFTINTIPLVTQGVVAVRIVRVERKENDRTIYSQGAIGGMFQDTYLASARFSAFPRITMKSSALGTAANYVLQPNLMQFMSPEVSYFKDIEPKNTDYIKCQARMGGASGLLNEGRYIYYNYNPDGTGSDYDGGFLGEGAFIAGNYNKPLVSFSRYKNTTPLTTLNTYRVLEGMIAGIVECGAEDENNILFTFSSTPILNRAIDYNGGVIGHQGPAGTCAILVLNTSVSTTELSNILDVYETFLVDYKKAGVGGSQYGGLTYEARQTNTYIECSDYLPITGTSTDTTNVYGGDTYIEFYEHLKTIFEADDNKATGTFDVSATSRIAAIEAFPVETHINLDLTHGAKFSKDYLNNVIYAIRESKGDYMTDDTNATIQATYKMLIQEEDMYQYNSVYSQQNSTKVYFPKPSEFLATVHDDTLVKISNEKYPREEVDSFVKFLTDNEKVLPTQFGEITDLFLFKNYMITFFEHAFGSLSIDERALLPIQNNSILELGAANNLQFFDFISTRSGSMHPQSIDYCGEGFVWFDATLGSMGYYNGSTQDIGLVKGMSSPLKKFAESIKNPLGSYFNNQFTGGNILCYENQKYKESVCTFIISEMAVCSAKNSTEIVFSLIYSPASYLYPLYDVNVIIDGIEYIAHTVSRWNGTDATGALTINKTDNLTLSEADWSVGKKYFIYYKDLSYTYGFSSITNSFMYEVDMFPTWLLEYDDDLFTIFGKFNIYKENYGNYGELYGIYRQGELEYLLNPKGSYVCVFNNYEYAMEAYDSNGVDMPNETWDTVSIMNDYQYTASRGTLCQITSGATNGISMNPADFHDQINGSKIMFSGSGLPPELDNETIYYVLDCKATNFQVSESLDGDPIIFSLAQATYSGYYHTLDVPMVTAGTLTNNKRRVRTWRIKDLRDMKGYVAGVFKPRIRDTHVRLRFKYNHADNKRILMHDLNTYYTAPRETLGNM